MWAAPPCIGHCDHEWALGFGLGFGATVTVTVAVAVAVTVGVAGGGVVSCNGLPAYAW